MRHGLTIARTADSFALDGVQEFAVSRLSVGGAMRVPADGYPITVQVLLALADDSGTSDARLVKCDIADLSDERGWFQSLRTVAAPTQDWDADGFFAGIIPDFALLAARSGRVDLMATVRVMEGQDPHRIIGEGRCPFPFDQPDQGFMEWDADQLDGDRHVASLAVATAAIDRTVHQSEVNVIRRFFRTRYEGRPDADDLRAQLSLTLQKSLRRIETGEASPARLIEDASSVLFHEYGMTARKVAYMLVVRVAAADRVLAAEERGLLEVVGASLGLPPIEMASAKNRIRAEAHFISEFVG